MSGGTREREGSAGRASGFPPMRPDASFFRRVTTAPRVALAFAAFGAGAILLGLSLAPIRIVCRAQTADTIGQRMVSRAFRLFLVLGRGLGLWRITGSGVAALAEPGRLLISNHPTLIDVVILLGWAPRVDCVVKSAAWRNPVLMWIVRMAGYVSNDRGDQVVDACAERLRAGRSVLLFPEGSRSPAYGLRDFQRGAAHVALRSHAEVLPILIRVEPRVLSREQPWYAYPANGADFHVEVGEPERPSAELAADAPAAIRARRLTLAWREMYDEWRARVGGVERF